MADIYINDDAWCFFANRSGEPCNCTYVETMDEAGLKRQIDYYAVPGVKGIIFNANAMRAIFDSRSFDPLWKGMIEGDDGIARFNGVEIESNNAYSEDLVTLCRNVKKLYEKVKDPFRIRYDYCREKGVEMWISMRMNDVHYVDDPERIMHSDFWRENPDLRRAFYRKDFSFWFSQCMDYEHDEVYEYHMALVKEYLERFEMDGFELDWMRSPFFFKPGSAEQGGTILTRFMREVKEHVNVAADRWGHPVKINVRVPACPEEALNAGFDVFTWAREGLMDMISPSPYFCTSESTMPIRLWKNIIPDNILLAPTLEQHVGTDYSVWMKSTVEVDSGFATSYLYQGAGTIYLFNHMFRCGLNDRDKQQELYSYIGNYDIVKKRERRHVATSHECMIDGVVNVPAFNEKIPVKSCGSVRLNVGGGTKNRNARIFLGISNGDETTLEVRLNTVRCSLDVFGSLPELPDIEMKKLVFIVPDGVLHDGENLIDLINKGESEIVLKWAEIHLIKSNG